MAEGTTRKASMNLSPDAFNRSLRIYFNFSLGDKYSGLVYSFGPTTGSFTRENLLEKGFSEKAIKIWENVLAIPGVSHLNVSSTQITVYKFVPEEWNELRPLVEEVIVGFDIEIKPMDI